MLKYGVPESIIIEKPTEIYKSSGGNKSGQYYVSVIKKLLADRISSEKLEEFIAYVKYPNILRWDSIHGFLIKGSTLWQILIMFDPTFPRTGRCYDSETLGVTKEWERFPTRKELVDSITSFLKNKQL